MGQHVGVYEGIRIYGPRAALADVEKRAKRAAIPLTAVKPCITKHISGAGKPYYVEAWGVAVEGNTSDMTIVFSSRRDGKTKMHELPASDVAFDLNRVQTVNPEDDVRMSWDDAKLAWRACRLFAEADLCGSNREQAHKLRVEAHGIYQLLKGRVTKREEGAS